MSFWQSQQFATSEPTPESPAADSMSIHSLDSDSPSVHSLDSESGDADSDASWVDANDTCKPALHDLEAGCWKSIALGTQFPRPEKLHHPGSIVAAGLPAQEAATNFLDGSRKLNPQSERATINANFNPLERSKIEDQPVGTQQETQMLVEEERKAEAGAPSKGAVNFPTKTGLSPEAESRLNPEEFDELRRKKAAQFQPTVEDDRPQSTAGSEVNLDTLTTSETLNYEAEIMICQQRQRMIEGLIQQRAEAYTTKIRYSDADARAALKLNPELNPEELDELLRKDVKTYPRKAEEKKKQHLQYGASETEKAASTEEDGAHDKAKSHFRRTLKALHKEHWKSLALSVEILELGSGAELKQQEDRLFAGSTLVTNDRPVPPDDVTAMSPNTRSWNQHGAVSSDTGELVTKVNDWLWPHDKDDGAAQSKEALGVVPLSEHQPLIYNTAAYGREAAAWSPKENSAAPSAEALGLRPHSQQEGGPHDTAAHSRGAATWIPKENGAAPSRTALGLADPKESVTKEASGTDEHFHQSLCEDFRTRASGSSMRRMTKPGVSLMSQLTKPLESTAMHKTQSLSAKEAMLNRREEHMILSENKLSANMRDFATRHADLVSVEQELWDREVTLEHRARKLIEKETLLDAERIRLLDLHKAAMDMNRSQKDISERLMEWQDNLAAAQEHRERDSSVKEALRYAKEAQLCH